MVSVALKEQSRSLAFTDGQQIVTRIVLQSSSDETYSRYIKRMVSFFGMPSSTPLLNLFEGDVVSPIRSSLQSTPLSHAIESTEFVDPVILKAARQKVSGLQKVSKMLYNPKCTSRFESHWEV